MEAFFDFLVLKIRTASLGPLLIIGSMKFFFHSLLLEKVLAGTVYDYRLTLNYMLRFFKLQNNEDKKFLPISITWLLAWTVVVMPIVASFQS